MQLGLGISPTQPYGVAVPAFTPASISGLQLWLDASDASTLFTDSAGTTAAVADGDPVGCWKDKSGNGMNVLQTDGTKKPILKINQQNNRSVIRSNGINNSLSNSSNNNSLISNKRTFFFAIKKNLLYQNESCVFDVGFCCALTFLSNNVRWYNLSPSSVATSALNMIISITDNGVGSYSDLVINGSAQILSSQQSAPIGNGSFTLFSLDKQSAFFINCDLLECVYYSRALLSQERGNIESYLNNKWSIY